MKIIKKLLKSVSFWILMVFIGIFLSFKWDSMSMVLSDMFSIEIIIPTLICTFILMGFFGILFLIVHIKDKKHREFRNELKNGDKVKFSPPSHSYMDGEIVGEDEFDENYINVVTRVPKRWIYKPEKK